MPPPPPHICTPECLTVKCIMEDPLNSKDIALHAFHISCPNGFNVMDVTMSVRIKGKKSSYCAVTVHFQKINGQRHFNYEQSKEDVKALTRKLPSTIEVTKGHSCSLDPCSYSIEFVIKCSCHHPFNSKTTMSAKVLTAPKLLLSAMNTVAVVEALISRGVPIVNIEYDVIAHHKCGYIGGSVIVLSKQAANNAMGTCSTKTTHRIETGESISSRFRYASYGKFSILKISPSFHCNQVNNFIFSVDILWMDNSTTTLDLAYEFSKAVYGKYPGQNLTYNCSPSFNWGRIEGECSGPELLRLNSLQRVLLMKLENKLQL